MMPAGPHGTESVGRAATHYRVDGRADRPRGIGHVGKCDRTVEEWVRSGGSLSESLQGRSERSPSDRNQEQL